MSAPAPEDLDPVEGSVDDAYAPGDEDVDWSRIEELTDRIAALDVEHEPSLLAFYDALAGG